jgi:arylsulfatase A-like enzyme
VIVWGPGIRKGHELSIPAQLMDVAPTILRLLGLEYPQGWEGTAIDEVFAE